MQRRDLLNAGAAAAAVVAPLAAPSLANAQGSQPRVSWRCPGSFPKSLDTLFGTQEHICRRVAEMTDGAFQIRASGPGEIVPALQVLDAAGGGTVECGFTSAYYYLGKDPSLAIATCLPFGLNSRQTWSWLTFGGGREALKPVYNDQGVHGIPAGCTGAQMGGWFRREIRSVADLNGLKFRIAGYGGSALQKLGVIPQQIPGSDLYPALERGVLDAAEWVSPHDDEKLGFNRVAPFYYYPGWWEWAPSIDMVVNLRAWEQLPAHYKAVLEAACAEGWHWMAARYDALNPAALRRLVASGTQLRGFPRDVLLASHKACTEVYAELGAANPRFRAIHEGWDRFRQDQQSWFRVAEDSQSGFLSFVAQQQRG